METRIRRKPEAIIKSFEMDPDKKAVYVEGKRDRLFFEYLFSDINPEETIFFEIDTVDIIADEGGNRTRLINFAESIANTNAKIKCFIDADFHRILNNQQLPPDLIVTDFRDLESYLYDTKYLNKFIKVGLQTDRLTPEYFLDEFAKAKEIAVMRVCSEQQGFKLPFQRVNSNFRRYYSVANGLNATSYLSALINAATPRPTHINVENGIAQAEITCAALDLRNLAHGKDVIEIVREIAASVGYNRDNIDLVFWMSFDSHDVDSFPSLKEVKDFIT